MTPKEISAALCAVRLPERVLAALEREEERLIACLLDCLREDARATEQMKANLETLGEVVAWVRKRLSPPIVTLGIDSTGERSAASADARRYRFFRDLALSGKLEAAVALGQADFMPSFAEFDAWADTLRERPPCKNRADSI